jgi:hypothetical protein
MLYSNVLEENDTRVTINLLMFHMDDKYIQQCNYVMLFPFPFYLANYNYLCHHVLLMSLIQKTSLVSADKPSLISARQADIIQTI